MGKSHNPEGTARVTDRELLEALNKAYENSDPDAITVTSSEVAEYVAIKRPAVKKRLDKLALEGNGVKRYKGTQAYNYYPEEVADNPNTVVETATPAAAPVEPARRGWREYETRVLAWAFNDRLSDARGWLDHPETGNDWTMLIPFIVSFAKAFIVSYIPVLWITALNPLTVVLISSVVGLLSAVWSGIGMLMIRRRRSK